MKRIFTLLLTFFVMSALNSALAQCTPESNELDNSSDLVYPNPDDTAITMIEGQYTEFVISFRVPPNFTGQVDSVVNIPPGLGYNCNPPSCIFSSGDHCIMISGTPTEAGVFTTTAYITASFFTLDSNLTANYDVEVQQASGIRSIDDSHLSFSIYPNPVKANPSFAFRTDKPRTGTISMYDITGTLVDQFNVQLEKGNNQFLYDISGYSPGHYFGTFKTADKTRHIKMIVVK
jgi:hypothetical protein